MQMHVGLRLDGELYDRLSVLADTLHVDRSWLIRFAIAELLEGSKKNVINAAKALTRVGPGIRLHPVRHAPPRFTSSDNFCDDVKHSDPT